MNRLAIPQAAIAQHAVVLGKTGAGKSSALRHVVENLLSHNKRVCVIDPKGDWWGLKIAADGRSPGLPVILFGDFKNAGARDIPLSDRSGKHVADLVASGNRPCVIGLRGWTQGAMTRFWIDFASTLFAHNAGELYLVGDEFHNFAPKQWKGMSDRDTPVGVGLHWANRLLSEGRGLGLVCLIASQRPQKVHNDTLTSCETLVAMKVIHAADRDAVKVWIDGNGDPEVGMEVMSSLAGMPRGDAWVWSPEINFGPRRVKFPMFETFDSFAPPQLQKRVSDRGWADVNLEEVKQKLADVVKEAEDNDPRKLKAEVSRLTAELNKSAATPPGKEDDRAIKAELRRARTMLENVMKFIANIKTVGFPADVDQKNLEAAIAAAVERVGKQINAELGTKRREFDRWRADGEKLLAGVQALLNAEVPVDVTVRHNEPYSVTPARHISHAEHRARADGLRTAPPSEGLTGPEQRVLDSLAWWASIGVEAPDKGQVGFLACYRVGKNVGGTFGNILGALRTRGLIDYPSPGAAALTPEGKRLARAPDQTPTTEILQQAIMDRLDGPESRVLRAIIDAYPEKLTKQDAGKRSGYQVGDNVGGTFGNILGRLRSLGLIEYPSPGNVVALPVLFLDA